MTKGPFECLDSIADKHYSACATALAYASTLLLLFYQAPLRCLSHTGPAPRDYTSFLSIFHFLWLSPGTTNGHTGSLSLLVAVPPNLST